MALDGRWSRGRSAVTASSDQRADGALSLGDKYTDAFWRVVPIPMALGASLIGVLASPSALAVVALVLIGIVGLLVEVMICSGLRTRWDAALSPEAVRDWTDNSWLPGKVAVFAIVMVGALTWKGHNPQGMPWGEAALSALIGLPIYVALVAIAAAIAKAVGHRD